MEDLLTGSVPWNPQGEQARGLWVILYDIDLGDGPVTRQAGPYSSLGEVAAHRADIEGYEGITNVRVQVASDV